MLLRTHLWSGIPPGNICPCYSTVEHLSAVLSLLTSPAVVFEMQWEIPGIRDAAQSVELPCRFYASPADLPPFLTIKHSESVMLIKRATRNPSPPSSSSFVPSQVWGVRFSSCVCVCAFCPPFASRSTSSLAGRSSFSSRRGCCQYPDHVRLFCV